MPTSCSVSPLFAQARGASIISTKCGQVRRLLPSCQINSPLAPPRHSNVASSASLPEPGLATLSYRA